MSSDKWTHNDMVFWTGDEPYIVTPSGQTLCVNISDLPTDETPPPDNTKSKSGRLKTKQVS